MGRLFLSQSFQELAKCLADALASDGSSLLQKRWILVPNAPIKQWLSLQLGAQNIFTGCKICSLEEALFPEGSPCPTHLEMVCLIYNELQNEPALTQFLQASPKKKLELAEHLATLFSTYGIHGKSLLGRKGDWQLTLFEKLFTQGSFRLPVQIFPSLSQKIEDPVHCFGFDSLPEIYWESLHCLAHLNVYLFSPCLHFWEDVSTSWEKRKLIRFWGKKGVSLGVKRELENYLSEAPPLLANWGKLGRETLKTLDRFSFEVFEAYEQADLKQNTLLHSLQKEIVFFEQRDRLSTPADESIEILLTGSSKMNEVVALKEEILRLASQHQIPFSEIAVLAPDIRPYAPLIEFLFSDEKSEVPYRIFGVDAGLQSSFYQGLNHICNLVDGVWTSEEIIALIETGSVYRRQKWKKGQIDQFTDWVREIFLSTSWKKGIEEKIYRLATLLPHPHQTGTSLADLEQLGELLFFLQSLEDDLAPLKSAAYSLGQWAEQWELLASKYLFFNAEEEFDVSAWNTFHRQLLYLRKGDLRMGGLSFPFEVIQSSMQQSSSGAIHATHLHAVRIGSIEPGAILPAKALFLIGMDEENFPRKRARSSLNLLKNEPLFIPDSPDIDRYLFLQILFAAQDFLKMSYGHLSPDEGKPVGPSLLVEELLKMAPIPCHVASKKTEALQIPVRFSIRSPNPPPFERERTLSLSDLLLFARHPWRYYLKKIEGIYLSQQLDPSFPMQRSPLLRSSIRWPLETLLDTQLDLPAAGMFREAFSLDLRERIDDWKEKYKSWETSIVSLSFLETAQEKRQTQGRIECPPLEFDMEDGSSVFLTGEISDALEEGALHFGPDAIGSLLKVWPEVLATSVALGTSQIYFLKNGKVKSIENPKKSLQSFISYYLRCMETISPLLPDWADSLLRKGAESFDGKTEYEDPIVEWLAPRLDMPPPDVLFTEWSWLKEVFHDLIALYPVRAKGGVVHEEV